MLQTPADEIHGVANSRAKPFGYLPIIAPPQDFTRRTSGAAEGSASAEDSLRCQCDLIRVIVAVCPSSATVQAFHNMGLGKA